MLCQEQGTDVVVQITALRSQDREALLEFGHDIDLQSRTISCYLEIDRDERIGFECVLEGQIYHSRCDLTIDSAARCYGSRRGHNQRHTFKFWSGAALDGNGATVPVQFWTQALREDATSNADPLNGLRCQSIGSVDVDVYLSPDEDPEAHTLRHPLQPERIAELDITRSHHEVPLTHIIEMNRGGRPLQHMASWHNGLSARYRPGKSRFATFRFFYRSAERLSQYGKRRMGIQNLILPPSNDATGQQRPLEISAARNGLNLDSHGIPNILDTSSRPRRTQRRDTRPVTQHHQVLDSTPIGGGSQEHSQTEENAETQGYTQKPSPQPEHNDVPSEGSINVSTAQVGKKRKAAEDVDSVLGELIKEREAKAQMLVQRKQYLADLKRQCIEVERQVEEQGLIVLNEELVAVEREIADERQRYERMRRSRSGPTVQSTTVASGHSHMSFPDDGTDSRRSISEVEYREVIDLTSSDGSPTTSSSRHGKAKEVIALFTTDEEQAASSASSSDESPPPRTAQSRRKASPQIIIRTSRLAMREQDGRDDDTVLPAIPVMSERKRGKQPRRSPQPIDADEGAMQQIADAEPFQESNEDPRNDFARDSSATGLQGDHNQSSRASKSKQRKEPLNIRESNNQGAATAGPSISKQKLPQKRGRSPSGVTANEASQEVSISRPNVIRSSASSTAIDRPSQIHARPWEDGERSPPMRQTRNQALPHSKSWLRSHIKTKGPELRQQPTTREPTPGPSTATASRVNEPLVSNSGPDLTQIDQSAPEEPVRIKQEGTYRVKYKTKPKKKVKEIML